MARLQGRRIIITGGASGIGRATAALFRQEGAAVAVLDRTASPDGAPSFEVDVSDATSVANAVAAAVKALGGLDGVVNAAGIFSDAGLADTSAELFTRTLAVNLTGTFLVMQAAAPHLKSAGGGTIVNIASGVGLTPTGPGSTAYVASKSGVIGLTKAVAMELAPAVRVNSVCPGAVDTPMTHAFLVDASGATVPGIARRYALGRSAAPDELAAAILFLTSNESSFVTGIALPVDGGRTYH
ncbi:MAG: SDR family oxidoreductase [Proteobacteria bacterium]|nr:SDR family oxidoreductase [Pseudomonadota bacterium]